MGLAPFFSAHPAAASVASRHLCAPVCPLSTAPESVVLSRRLILSHLLLFLTHPASTGTSIVRCPHVRYLKVTELNRSSVKLFVKEHPELYVGYFINGDIRDVYINGWTQSSHRLNIRFCDVLMTIVFTTFVIYCMTREEKDSRIGKDWIAWDWTTKKQLKKAKGIWTCGTNWAERSRGGCECSHLLGEGNGQIDDTKGSIEEYQVIKDHLGLLVGKICLKKVTEDHKVPGFFSS